MDNKTTKKLKQSKRRDKRQKGAIIGLSIALLLAGATAVTVPLVLVANQGNTPSPSPSPTPTTITHIVTFDTNQGNPIDPVKVVDGEKCVQPQATRAGYTIREWTLNGQTYNFDTPVKSDITLKAEWDEEQKSTFHTVTFDPNGGTTDAKTTQVVHGGYINMPGAYKDGYSLDGWYSGSKKYTSNDPITSNLNLVAKWNDIPVVEYKTIVFNAGDHATFKPSGEKIATTSIQAGKAFGTVSAPERDLESGYATAGWYLDSEFKNPIKDTTIITDTTTVYAKYLKLTTDVTTTFSCNTSNNEVLHGNGNVTFEKGKTWADIKSDAPTVTRDYYHFDGWYVNGAPITDSYKFDTNTTLVAHMTPLQHLYTFKFKLTGDQVIKDGAETVQYDVGSEGAKWSAIPKPKIEDGSKIFEGWYYDKELTDPILADETFTSETGTESTDVYANFVEAQVNPTITFADPTSSNDDTYTWVGNRIIKAESPTIEFSNVPQPGVYKNATGSWTKGYDSPFYFTKWYTIDPDDGSEIDVPTIIDANIKIYPKFEAKPILIFKQGESELSQVTLNPKDTWDKIPKPDDKVQLQTDERLQGWEGKFTNESTTRLIKPSDSIDKLDTKVPLTPKILDEYNELIFIDQGIINPIEESSTPITVSYEGNPNVGIEKVEQKLIDINKPIAKADGHQFLSWQYSLDNQVTWQLANPSTKIPNQAIIYMRPVMEANIQVSYNAGDHGSIPTEQQEPIETNSSTKFAKMFKPDVEAASGYVFSHWEMNTGTEQSPVWTKVDSDTKFTSSTTLYARYKTDKVTSIVYFKLTPTDEEAKDAKIYTDSYAIVHENDQSVKFSDAILPYATKKLHKFDKWVIRTGDGTIESPFKYETEVDPETVIPVGKTGLTVYATFTQDITYQKISIAEPTNPGDYEILSNPNVQYHQTGQPFPLNELDLKVKKVGYVPDNTNWTYVDDEGKTKKITKNTIVEKDMVITPHFKECKWEVKFSKDLYPLCTMSEDVLQIDNYDTLYDKIKDRTASLERYDFSEWKIKNNDSYESIDENTVVTGPLTIVPTFKGESEFKNGTQPYFYDEEAGKWAAITDSSGTSLAIRYAGSETSTSYDKSKFNYEIFFGSQMASIPDYFLSGCINFNNGSDGETEKPLTMPKNLTRIGRNVMHGCASFNQKMDFSQAAAALTIDENFLKECYSFNKDLSFNTNLQNATIKIYSGFMFDCMSFTKTLDLTGRSFVHIETEMGAYVGKDFYYFTLSTSDKLSSMYKTGFTVMINSSSYSTFNNLFPNLSGDQINAYRKITIQQI